MNEADSRDVTRFVVNSGMCGVIAAFARLAAAFILLAASFAAGLGAPDDDPLPSWNDGPAKTGDHRIRASDHDGQVEPEVRAARRAHRDLRPGRHAVGRASDVHAGDLLPGPGTGGRKGEAGTRERRAVQDRVVGRPRGDGEALDGRPRKDSRRHAHRHECRRFKAEAKKWLDDRQGPALEAALYRTHLPADASRC